MTADITLRGPGDVVAVLPYQLGYHPRDSVVVVTLHGRRVGLVARVDLPPDDDVDEVVASLMGPLVREGATSVIVVGFEDVADRSQPLLLALVERLEQVEVDVVDVAVVRGGRRYSPVCSEPCCPPEGVELPDPAAVPGVAELVALGRSPLGSREAVEGLVRPEPWRCLGVARAVESRARMPRRRRRSAAAWAALLARGEPGLRAPDRRVVADVALGLADIPLRDGLIAWLAPGVLPTDALDPRVVSLLRSSLNGWGGMGLSAPGRPMRLGDPASTAVRQPPHEHHESLARLDPADLAELAQRADRAHREVLAADRDEILQRLLALCRSVPDECPVEAAAVCTVAAHVAWVGGDGAVARAAVDRALRLDPGYRLARLLENLVERGVRLPPLTAPGAEPGEGLIDRAG